MLRIVKGLSLAGFLGASLFQMGCRSLSSDERPTELKKSLKSDSGLVFLLSGQSNMDGQSLIPSHLKSLRIPNVKSFCVRQFQFNPDRETLKYGQPPARWTDFEACGSQAGLMFGPEVTFGKAMAEKYPGKTVYLIKFAPGGTSQGCEWQPNEKSPAYRNYGDAGCDSFISFTKKTPDALRSYKRLVAVYSMAMNGLRAQGVAAQFGGILWLQGEGDADGQSPFRFLSENYEQNLRHFIKQIRFDTGSPKVPFVLAKIKCGWDNAQWDPNLSPLKVVREAQDAVVSPKDGIKNFDTWDLKFQSDGCHFDAESMEKIGQRFAEMF